MITESQKKRIYRIHVNLWEAFNNSAQYFADQGNKQAEEINRYRADLVTEAAKLCELIEATPDPKRDGKEVRPF